MSKNVRRQTHREVKKRGFILSFGDIILPFVGVMAIGLLVVAGKLFFSGGIGVHQADDMIPQLPEIGSRQADAAQIEQTLLSDSGADTSAQTEISGAYDAVPLNEESKTQQLDLLAIPYKGDAGMPAGTGTASVTVTAKPVAQSSAQKPAQSKPAAQSAKPAAASSGTAGSSGVKSKGKTVAVKPQQSRTQQPAAKTTASKPAASSAKPAAQASTAASQWRVQVGAYGTKQAANDTVAKLGKSGYTATIFSSQKFHKVWVQAGTTKQAAESVMAKLKNGGYPGSYIVPPAAKN